MKKAVIIWLFCLAAGSSQLKAQYYVTGYSTDIQKFINQTKYDTIARLERLAALEFHRLLNNYRLSKNLDTVAWSDVFWMACRNHSIYMIKNKDLTHTQKENMPYFTGKSPGDRLNYVQNASKEYSWSGENALYNWSGNGKNLEEKARNIASSSFEQWKNSPGHNANMLTASHKYHGVAFIVQDYLVYGTSLFGFKSGNYFSNSQTKVSDEKENPSATISKKPEETTTDKTLNINTLRKETEFAVLEKIQQEGVNIKQDKALLLAAKKHSDYMSLNQSSGHSEKRNGKGFYGKTSTQRIARAKGDFLWFLRQKSNTNEYIAFLEFNTFDDNNAVISEKIKNELLKNIDLKQQVINNAAVSVKIKKKKDKLSVWATLIVEYK